MIAALAYPTHLLLIIVAGFGRGRMQRRGWSVIVGFPRRGSVRPGLINGGNGIYRLHLGIWGFFFSPVYGVRLQPLLTRVILNLDVISFKDAVVDL